MLRRLRPLAVRWGRRGHTAPERAAAGTALSDRPTRDRGGAGVIHNTDQNMINLLHDITVKIQDVMKGR